MFPVSVVLLFPAVSVLPVPVSLRLPDRYRPDCSRRAAETVPIKYMILLLSLAQASDIKATVNLTGLKEGTYTLSIQFQLPGGCSLDDTYKAAVKIQAQAAQTQPETTTQQTQETTTAGTSETTGQNR